MKKRLLVISMVVLLIAYHTYTSSFDIAQLSGKRVLVTGASSGIGEQLAYQYAKAGASVFITARRTAELKKVTDKCRLLGSQGAKFGYIAADMSDMEQTDGVIKEAVEYLGGLDQVILNHAYIPPPVMFGDTQESFDILEKVMDINMRSYAHLAVKAVPYLKESNGSLGVVSSGAGKFGYALIAPYCASKHALQGFFEGFRFEVNRINVSVTVAVLGGIGTEGLDNFMKGLQERFKGIKSLEEYGFRPASPADCAYEIMRGTTMREREIYFPPEQFIKLAVLLREFLVRLPSPLPDVLQEQQ